MLGPKNDPLFNKGEINESDKRAMLLKSEQIARAHSLHKTHKHYERLPKLDLLSTQQIHITMGYSSFYQTYLIH